MRPIIILLVAAFVISAFGLSGHALGEILDEFSPNNSDETNTVDEKLEINLGVELINGKNSIGDQNFSAK
ncbi:MAG: hypothetical protein IIA19_09355 [Thaumarchaeota archaeon]|nr:hypothetical protein [Nitrososphaerota archaeon]